MTPNIPTSTNNPGDLRFAGQSGAQSSSAGFAQFSNPQQGYAALLNQIQTDINNHPDWTLEDFATNYAPPSQNNTGQYTANLANKIGVAPNTKIGTLQSKIGNFADAIASNEGFQAGQSSGSIPITQLGQQPQSQPQGGIPITPLNTSNVAQQSQPTTQQQFNQSLPLGTKILQGQPVGAQEGVDTGIGIAKGIGSTLLGASGATTNPVIKGMLANAPALQSGVNTLQQAVTPSNPTQAAASGNTQFAANLLPIGGGATEAADALREAAVPDKALQIASEKPTLGTVAKGLMSFGQDAQTAKDAKAIEPLVRDGSLVTGNGAAATAKNTATLQGEITRAATKLASDLKNGDVQQIVQPEQIDGIAESAQKTIAEEADNVEQAQAKFQQYWNKFQSYLPKDKDVLPSDTLAARQKFDKWLGRINKSSIFDPTTENSKTIAARLVRQGANELTASNAPSVAVKDSLSYQSSLYNVLENVAKKGAPAVKKAQEIAEMPGIKGILARHPYTAGIPAAAAGSAITGLIGGTAAYEGAKALGFNPLGQ